MCFPVNFAKFLRTLLYRTLPDDCFWIFSFILLLLPTYEPIKTSFFYLFLKMFYHERDEYHEFKRPSCCCIGTYIPRWHHKKFSGALCTDYWISVLPCLAIIDLDIRLGLKWNLGSCHEVFCKKGVLKYLLNSQENTCARVSFFNKVLQARGL